MSEKQKSVKTCPQCHSVDIKKKMSGLTVIILGVMVVILSRITLSPPWMQNLLALFGIGFLAIIYVLNKNVCKACGHRWR